MLSKTFSVALATVVGLLLSPAGVFATPAVEPRAYGGVSPSLLPFFLPHIPPYLGIESSENIRLTSN